LVLGIVVGAFAGPIPNPPAAQAQEFFRPLTTEQLEATLKKAKIEYKKLEDRMPGTYFYDYKQGEYAVRLYYLNGKELMVDTLMPALPLDKVNHWNLGAKYSRAGVTRDDKGDSFTVVESRLNIKGGVTEETIRDHLSNFIDELAQFHKLAKAGE